MTATNVQNRIAAYIKAKRREEGLGVREAAKVTSISAATFSRLERGISATLPDVATLEKLSKWLGLSMGELLGERKNSKDEKLPNVSTPEWVQVHLRADKNLTPQTSKALGEMFKVLYEQAAKKMKK